MLKRKPDRSELLQPRSPIVPESAPLIDVGNRIDMDVRFIVQKEVYECARNDRSGEYQNCATRIAYWLVHHCMITRPDFYIIPAMKIPKLNLRMMAVVVLLAAVCVAQQPARP